MKKEETVKTIKLNNAINIDTGDFYLLIRKEKDGKITYATLKKN